jgi:hypothetical protein
MNKKFLSRLTMLGMTFALVFVLGSFNVANAVPGENGDAYNLPAGQTNLFGEDAANNTAGTARPDADTGAFAPQSQYGLGMQSQQ